MRDITTKILLGDSRKVLKTLNDNSVDLIVGVGFIRPAGLMNQAPTFLTKTLYYQRSPK